MEVTCRACKYRWDYKGKSVNKVTCPRCHLKTKVFLIENLKYAKPANCLECGKKFFKWRETTRYCSKLCQARYAGKIGSKVLHEKYDMKGSNNPNWKGGISKDNYRYKKIQVERYPERVNARHYLHKRIESGKVIPKERCEHCNKKTKLHGHHEDYSKPLDVIWLCRPCHRKLHGGRH
jgi:hypothetical protein